MKRNPIAILAGILFGLGVIISVGNVTLYATAFFPFSVPMYGTFNISFLLFSMLILGAVSGFLFAISRGKKGGGEDGPTDF